MPQIIKAYKTSKLPILQHGKPVVCEMFKGDFSKAEIKKFVEDRTKAMKDADFKGKLSVSLLYSNVRNARPIWRSGQYTMVGDKVYFYNINSYDKGEVEEQDHFSGFQIYYRKDAPKKGGCSGVRNDCLYNSIKSVMGQDIPWMYPGSMKKFLNLERNDMVDISHIPAIEKKLKSFRINVTGDHTHTSVLSKCQRLINLKLVNAHYKLSTIAGALKVKGIAFEDKLPLFYDNYKCINYAYSLDKGLHELSKTEFHLIRSKPISSKYILIHARSKDLLTEYNQFIIDANILKAKTDGLINLYRSGSCRSTALHLFNHFNKSIIAEPILQTESIWIAAASYAAIIFADKYEGPAYQYDVCSHYPSSMSNKFMLFPTKPGIFAKITDDQLVARNTYGIYRCIIKLSDNIETNKLFRLNPRNYYTHLDLQCAHRLDLTVNMIIDDQPNQLYYKRDDLVTGHQLFGQYFDYMFDLKQQSVPLAKEIINVLWGALCQKKLLKEIADDNNPVTLSDDHTVDTITQVADSRFLVQYFKNDSMFETNFARICPFILSRGRERITFLMAPYIKYIVRSHTDSMYSTVPLAIAVGNGMGDVKYIGFCENVKINNNVSIIGEFK